MELSRKALSHGSVLLQNLVRKLDAVGNHDGKSDFAERNLLQGTRGSSVEAILALDHLQSSGNVRGTRQVTDLRRLVSQSRATVAALNPDMQDGFIHDEDLKRLPRTGRNLALALIDFSVKHEKNRLADFMLKT